MTEDELQIVLLHHNWNYINDCCDLLNDEWPRSKTARMHALQSSNDKSPQSIVMLFPNNGNEKVVGHSKISFLFNYENACFVEAVVVHKEYRGRGWGKYLMQRTEEHAKKNNMKMVYLSTKDKLEFYKKLGYEECNPISIYGQCSKNENESPLVNKNNYYSPQKITCSSIPPPPPISSRLNSQPISTKVYLRKLL